MTDPQRQDDNQEEKNALKQAGARIRELREAVGLNQDVFADEIKTHRSYVGLLENGHRDVRLTTVYRIAATYGLQVYELLDPNFELKADALKAYREASAK